MLSGQHSPRFAPAGSCSVLVQGKVLNYQGLENPSLALVLLRTALVTRDGFSNPEGQWLTGPRRITCYSVIPPVVGEENVGGMTLWNSRVFTVTPVV